MGYDLSREGRREGAGMGVLTDVGVTLRIKTALIGDERIGARTIDVDTVDGVVTLRGSVRYEALRELAESIAFDHGAEEVDNQLRVEEPEFEGPIAILPDDVRGVTTPAGAEPVEGPS